MVAVLIALCCCQASDADKPLSAAERSARLKATLSPIHVSDPVAPIVKQALESPVTLSFDKTPLPNVVETLAPLLGGNIRLDPGAADRDEDGKVIELPTVTYQCNGVPLKTALEAMLSSVDLDYGFAFEGVEIGSHDYLIRLDEWRIYPIPDVLERMGSDGSGVLIQAIQEYIDREGWEPNGGDGEIQPLPGGALIVKCSPPTHRSVARFIEFTRRLLGPKIASHSLGILDLGDSPPLARRRPVILQSSEFFLPRLENDLRQRHDFEIRNATVRDALQSIERTIGVRIKVDDRALAEQARGENDDLSDRRITIVRKGIQARTALNLLREQGSHCAETAEGLVVKYGYGEEVSEFAYTWRYYPTDDLVRYTGPFGGHLPPSHRNQYLIHLIGSFANDTIPCFNEWPDLVVLDLFGFTGHLYRGPRMEHRRFEQLYSGMTEAVRRRAEIMTLLGKTIDATP
jgi:hypothetical protein